MIARLPGSLGESSGHAHELTSLANAGPIRYVLARGQLGEPKLRDPMKKPSSKQEVWPQPYEKMIDDDGITTEFIRCTDPTDASVVAKITRKRLSSPKEVGWA
jgi:hypothetical protein